MSHEKAMSVETLDEIETRAEAATKGPWRKTSDILKDCGCISTRSEDLFRSYASPPTIQTSRDCDFIAHAREDVPWLVAEVRRLLKERDELLKMIDAADRIVFENDMKKDPGGYGP